MAFIWLPDKLNARTHTHTHTYRRTHIKFHRTRGVATHTFKNSPPLFFNPMPIFPPAFSDLLLRFEWTKIQAMTRRVAESHVFILSLICSLDGWSKMHPKKSRGRSCTFFSPKHSPQSKYVLCRDDTIHVIKFPCYDSTYCNATSGLYSACICD